MTTIIPTPQTINPPSQTTLTDAQKRDIMLSINCARVATIVSYDPGVAGQRPPTATVQIAQQAVTRVDFEGNQTLSPYSELTLVPVWFPGGGGYSMTFPVKPGDECLLIFHDRELDNWYLNGAGLPPSLPRAHDLADAIALVGMRSSPRALGNGSTSAVQIISDNYTSPSGAGELLQITPGKIQMIADEVVIHSRNKTVVDSGGTGTVTTPALITNYTTGVTVVNDAPAPPEVPT